MVWEEVVEGGITRYVAVYHSTLPPEIGPMRSVRPMDPAIAAPLHGLLAFSGGQRPFVDAVAAAGLQVVSHDRGGRRLLPDRRPVVRRTTSTPTRRPSWPRPTPRTGAAAAPQFVLAAPGEQPTAVTGGTPAAGGAPEAVRGQPPGWTWSPPDGSWVRAEGSRPAVEADGTPLRATNVVVLRVRVVNTAAQRPGRQPRAGDRDGRVGGGAGGDRRRHGRRHLVKAVVGDPRRPHRRGRAPVRLAPGNTWVELVPIGTGSVSVG